MLGRERSMAIYCPNCGIELPDGVAFCDACGTPLRGAQGSAGGGGSGSGQLGSVVCPICNASALPGEAFCDNCGASLLAPTTYVAPSEAATSVASSFVVQASPSAATTVSPVSVRQGTAQLVVTSPPPPAT